MKNVSKIILAGALIMTLVINAMAQDPPVFSQFLANPYQFNPSYAAHNGYAEANVFYRKQWVGFDNAPEALSVNVQAPFGRNIAIGINAYSNKTVLLNNSAVLATFGYKVRFGSASHLNFGLSGGMGFNNFKMEALENSNDPALLNIIPRSNSLNAQFGVNLTLKKFNFGFALPTLLESKTTRSVENALYDKKFRPFDDKFASISYTSKMGDLTFVPAIIYRAFDDVQFQWEGMIVAHYKNVLWVGASYREGYGVTGIIGFNIKGVLRTGYTYEKPTGPISKAPNGGTHELYIGAQIGKYNRDEAVLAERIQKDTTTTVSDKIAYLEDLDSDDQTEKIEEDDRYENSLGYGRPDPNEPIYDDTTVHAEASLIKPISKQYYVVLGVYRHFPNALKQIANLRAKNMDPNVLYVPEKEYYYVYVYESPDREEAVKERKRTRQSNQFFGAWIYTPE